VTSNTTYQLQTSKTNRERHPDQSTSGTPRLMPPVIESKRQRAPPITKVTDVPLLDTVHGKGGFEPPKLEQPPRSAAHKAENGDGFAIRKAVATAQWLNFEINDYLTEVRRAFHAGRIPCF
jgi:hypothetical protein